MSHSGSTWSRTARGLITVLFALGVFAALEVFSRFLLEGSAVDGPRGMVEVYIPEGATIPKIADILHSRGLIDHPLLFRYAVRVMGADTKIQAGRMTLAGGRSLFELIRNLTRVKALGIPVTIPEGLTAAEIAGVLQRKLGVDSSAFMKVVQDTQLVRETGIEGPSLEGYLFPDTYFIAPHADVRRVAFRMVANFRNRVPKDVAERATAVGLTVHEVVTLASIIEWEAMLRSEAPVISSVYHNRLRRGMLLQADPTVSYALAKGPSRLYYSDLKVDSPYNTYLYPGLPPGPINNPGAASIEAAVRPASTGYLFFVARGDGTHAFTSSLEDHLDAKQKLDRIRNQATSSDSGANG